MVICLGRSSPTASSSLPAARPCLRLGAFWCGSHLAAYLALLRLGVTVPPSVAGGAVGSYPTFSPLPPLARGRCLSCGPVRRLAAPRCYLAVYPVELGLSSEPNRSRDHPARPAPKG